MGRLSTPIPSPVAESVCAVRVVIVAEMLTVGVVGQSAEMRVGGREMLKCALAFVERLFIVVVPQSAAVSARLADEVFGKLEWGFGVFVHTNNDTARDSRLAKGRVVSGGG